jgi:transposase
MVKKGMSYDKRFKERVLAHISKGHTQKATAELFGVSTSSIKEWRTRVSTKEGLDPRKRENKPKKLPPEKLTAYMSEHPDAYEREIAAEFGCVRSAVHKALKKLGITRKKRR